MAGGQIWLLVASAFVALTFKDFFVGTDAHKDIPEPKLSKFMGPSIKFLYCYSWGYNKVFQQYAGMLHQKYPEIAIEGDNFPPGGFRLQAAQFFSVAKMAIIVMVLASINIFQNIGQPTPSWWAWMLENKLYACMMTFFLCNAVETQLISTGAFEISLNDMPLWSKLESGRIPQPAELFQIIENHIRMRGVGTGGEDFTTGYVKDEL